MIMVAMFKCNVDAKKCDAIRCNGIYERVCCAIIHIFYIPIWKRTFKSPNDWKELSTPAVTYRNMSFTIFKSSIQSLSATTLLFFSLNNIQSLSLYLVFSLYLCFTRCSSMSSPIQSANVIENNNIYYVIM